LGLQSKKEKVKVEAVKVETVKMAINFYMKVFTFAFLLRVKPLPLAVVLIKRQK